MNRPVRGFNVGNFRSALNTANELLRTNKFRMDFFIPPGLIGLPFSGRINDTVRYLEFYCEVTNSPGLNLLTTEGRKYTFGPSQKRPYVTAFNDVTVTFYDDGRSDNFDFFNRWLRLINNSTLAKDDSGLTDGERVSRAAPKHYPYELSYRQEYITDADLRIFSNDGELSRHIKFRDIFPVGISDTPLNWSDTNSVLRLGVNFNFLEWYEVDPAIAQQQVYSK